MLANQGFAVTASDWRRAAHKCADLVYSRLSGQQPYLDTRVVYVAETGPKNNRQKRVAIMDSDGGNHRYLTVGRQTVVTSALLAPRRQAGLRQLHRPQAARPAVSISRPAPERLLIPGNHITFAPRFSPDGRDVVFSMANSGNTDIYVVIGERRRAAAADQRAGRGHLAQLLARWPPDRVRKRPVGHPAALRDERRRVGPAADQLRRRPLCLAGVEPAGNLIAFTKIAGPFRIGVMNASGGGERILTDGWQDEGPSWAPNGQFVMFHRVAQGAGAARLYAVPVDGGSAGRCQPRSADPTQLVAIQQLTVQNPRSKT